AWAALRGVPSWQAAPPAIPVEPGSLLLLPITIEETTPQNSWLREGLVEMLRSQLGQTPGIRIVALHRVDAALAAQQPGGGPRSKDAAARIARDLRAESVLTGSFVRENDSFVLSAQIVNTVDGRTEASSSVRGRYTEDLLDAVDELTLRLLHGLGAASKAGT